MGIREKIASPQIVSIALLPTQNTPNYTSAFPGREVGGGGIKRLDGPPGHSAGGLRAACECGDGSEVSGVIIGYSPHQIPPSSTSSLKDTRCSRHCWHRTSRSYVKCASVMLSTLTAGSTSPLGFSDAEKQETYLALCQIIYSVMLSYYSVAIKNFTEYIHSTINRFL